MGLSCSGGPTHEPPVPLDGVHTAEELHALLDSLCSRSDLQAMMARARIHVRLLDLEGSRSPTLLAQGDAADLDVLSHGAPEAMRVESASRLSRHFRERADKPELSRSAFPGDMGEPLRRLVLLTIASFYGECSTRADWIACLEKLSAATLDLAEKHGLSADSVRLLRKRSQEERKRVLELAASQAPLEPEIDAFKFCDADLPRHLEEGTRAADVGTREKADRAEIDGVLQWYLLALAHYGVVRETVAELTPAQEHALGAQEIVVRSLCDLLCREP
ncbi:MAG TPA: hypothetical protein VE981_14975 [Planctomycetota bacterium]|nr:hypothetical protein [Planctomycetota bacterium]